jgi:ABC-type polysaccharide/polyol phosphate export permease
MTSPRSLLEPSPEMRFRRPVRFWRSLGDVWRARELIRTLAERELRARYKQAILGFAWAVVTPLALMLVFTLFFDPIADVNTADVPYPLFAYLGLLPWTFFSTSVSQGGQSLIQNIPLLNKVYCPREVFPIASVAVAGLDMTVALLPLGLLFALFGFVPKATTVWVPLLLLVQVAFTLGVTLLISSVVVYLRDLRHALPVMLQLGLFATPVAYGIQEVPASLRTLYAAINPLAPVIDGYRRTVLLGSPPDWGLFLPGAVTALLILVAGYLLFKHLETGFADVA